MRLFARAVRLVRAPVALILAIALGLELGSSAVAVGPAGDVVVDVVDAITGAPVPLARVILAGDGASVGYTDAGGSSHFENVATGTYRASVTKRGYDGQRSRLFDVEIDRSTSVRVRLGRANGTLKTIGSVAVSSQALGAANDVAQDGPLRLLSGSLQDALGDVAGLTAAGDALAFEGRDPAQTGLMLDGVPLPGLGGSPASAGVNADLFASASASAQAQNGALGGTVSFVTLQPTRFPQQLATLQYAGNGSSALTLAARGSAGNLGYVLEHAARARTSPLDGAAFLDQSGLRYAHDADRDANGDLLKLRWSPSLAQTLSATVVASGTRSALACAAQSALLPCGYGPGNEAGSHANAAVLGETATIGSTTLFAGLGFNATSSFADLSHRYAGGVASPASSAYRAAGRSATLSVQFPAHEKHELSLHATAYRLSLEELSAQNGLRGTTAIATSYRELSFADAIRPNARLTFDVSAGFASSPGTHALQTGAGLRWQPARDDVVEARAFAGAVGAGISGADPSLPDAQSLQYFCDRGAATGSYGAAASPHERSSGVRARYAHASRRARFALSAWTERLTQSPVPGVIAADALHLPPDYLAGVGAVARSPYVCGAGTPVPAVLFTTQLLADQISRGVTAGGSVQLGSRTTLAAYAAVQSRFATGGDTRTAGLGSLTPLGAQIPGVPLHRAGLVASSRLGRALDVLANVSYTAGNNASRLPAYTVLNAGFALPLRYGSLAIVEQNLTNRFAAPIASSALAVPLARAGAAPLPVLASPLAPRTVTVTYTVRAGRSELAGSGAASRATTAGEPATETTTSFSIGDLPARPPQHALTIDPDSESCTPVAARATQPVLDEIGALAAAAERARAGGRYPDALPRGTRTVQGVALRYFAYGDASSYAIALDAGKSFMAFGQCARLAGGDAAAVAQRHLYAPPVIAKNGSPPLFYSPAAGVYAVFPAAETIRFDDEPASAPPDPLALRAECPAASRPLAVAVATALEAARRASRERGPLPASDAVAFVRHDAAAAGWLELRVGDPLAEIALERCLHVATVRAASLASAGFSLPRNGTLAFSDRFGIYVAVNER
jgi:Carboxypeptidase regulatory-like domain